MFCPFLWGLVVANSGPPPTHSSVYPPCYQHQCISHHGRYRVVLCEIRVEWCAAPCSPSHIDRERHATHHTTDAAPPSTTDGLRDQRSADEVNRDLVAQAEAGYVSHLNEHGQYVGVRCLFVCLYVACTPVLPSFGGVRVRGVGGGACRECSLPHSCLHMASRSYSPSTPSRPPPCPLAVRENLSHAGRRNEA